MPWRQKSMNDAVSCDKPRCDANNLCPGDFRVGKPSFVNPEESSAESIGGVKTTWGSEPSQYPQEEKTTVIPLVAASERGTAQTIVLARWGCRAHHTE